MRVLVTGVKGQLGHDVMNELAKRNHTGIGVDIEEMDITDAASVERVIKESNVEAVIHCAAWTLWIWRRMRTRLIKCARSMPTVRKISQRSARNLI